MTLKVPCLYLVANKQQQACTKLQDAHARTLMWSAHNPLKRDWVMTCESQTEDNTSAMEVSWKKLILESLEERGGGAEFWRVTTPWEMFVF